MSAGTVTQNPSRKGKLYSLGPDGFFFERSNEAVGGFWRDQVGEEESVVEDSLGCEDQGAGQESGLRDRHEGAGWSERTSNPSDDTVLLTEGAFAHSQLPREGYVSNPHLSSIHISSQPLTHKGKGILRTNNLKLLKCLSVPPTIPGTPAILSKRIIRNNQALSLNNCPFALNSVTGSGFISKTDCGMSVCL